MALEIKRLRVGIEGKEVIKGIDLRIEPGKVVALMGPNGSGKSSLAYALMGHPRYEVKGSVKIDGKDINELTPDERARQGLFLAFQYPVGIEGVSVKELLLGAMRERGEKISALELRRKVEIEAKELGVEKELLSRSVNDGFSGGEKKKIEILQMRILQPKYAVLDETDSGLDIDALRVVAEGARMVVEKEKVGVLVITHYQRILRYIQPDRVVVLKQGRVVDEGGVEVVEKLEREGYKFYD
ncbi:Iron-sulfur cluster assembly ATPase protein SufC [Candidatus Chazhemtobacterium aquaticus]|uniref:Iron-sulfur cluster assembly ATPase protein SufC n=2 Tax=Candidatus Chazhemtobacterium aquaticus TaxID=2715735 RepID=A0A857NAZ4_9BACT|nr:Iron-sulfur cluster assembly ATPase protein SufC [Candidatus Chazhemtobacterium aquaticus]